jgi:hypothetical protein
MFQGFFLGREGLEIELKKALAGKYYDKEVPYPLGPP